MLAAMALALLGATLPGAAWAQKLPASSFERLTEVLQIGDKVYVTDSAGRQHEGSLSALSPSALKLVQPGRIGEFVATEVVAIMRLEPDSKKNGALIGLGVGAAAGAVVGAYSAMDSATNATATALLGGLLWGGLGALIGTGLDALSPGRKVVVYDARAPGTSARLNLSPMVLPGRQSIVVRLSF
jgi:hypothetical protein